MGMGPILTLTPGETEIAACEDVDVEIEIGGTEYYCIKMGDDYDNEWQISAREGDIAVFDMVTYDYGDVIEWDELVKQKGELEEWARGICKRYGCSYKIFVTANYW